MASVSDPTRVVNRSAGWSGGVNLRDALPQIRPSEAKVMENGILDQNGAFVKRLGSTFRGTFGAAGDRCLALYTYYRYPAVPQMLMNTSAGKLYYTNDPFADPVVWTEFASGLSTTAPFSFETFKGAVYMGNGVDDFRKWDGTTQTTIPSAPKAAYLRLWKDTLFMTGNSSTPDRIYQSGLGDADIWPVAGWIDIGRGDGDRTTALSTDGQVLIVFKRDRHWTIYDPVTLANRVVDFEKGCESHQSVVEFESEIFFLSRRGICRFFGDSPSEVISSKVDPLFNHEVINFSALSRVTSYIVDNQVGWAIPELGSMDPTIQLEYYPRLAVAASPGARGVGPFVFHRIPSGVFARVRKGTADHLYGAKLGSNRFLELFSPNGLDDGVPFVSVLETDALDMGQPTHTKYIRRLRFYGRGQFQMVLKRNLMDPTYKTFALQLGSDEDPDEVIVNPDAYGRYFQMRFTDAMTASGFKSLDVGSHGVALVAGGWALHQYTIDADIMGVRD